MLKGAIHLHSTYSDGEFSLTELKKKLLAADCRFALMSDHADAFDALRLAAYLEECQNLSDSDFLFVPGLEYSCERRMHILGYGSHELCDLHDPQKVISYIRSHGGIAVIAHPQDEALEWIASFAVLPDGIEVWNTKYDGRYAPRPQVFELLNRLQRLRPELRAYYGQDLHWRKQCSDLFNELQTASLSVDHILNGFRRGEYWGTKGELRLPSSGQASPELLKHFGSLQARSQRLRRYMKATKRILDRAGIRLPSSLKAHLRRIT